MAVDPNLSLKGGEAIENEVTSTLQLLCSNECTDYATAETFFGGAFWEHVLQVTILYLIIILNK